MDFRRGLLKHYLPFVSNDKDQVHCLISDTHPQIIEPNNFLVLLSIDNPCVASHSASRGAVWLMFSKLFPLMPTQNTSLPFHHHHIALVARISLTLSRHSSLSFIALGRSSGQHPVSSHSCWMYVRAGRPAFARPCVRPCFFSMSGSSNLNSFRDRE